MSSEQKYTLGEAAGVAAIGVFVLPLTLLFVLVASTPFSLLDAWIFTQLWAWFVVPSFHLPVISVWVAFGLGLMYKLWAADIQVKIKPDETNWMVTLLTKVCISGMALFLGWIIHHFVLHGS